MAQARARARPQPRRTRTRATTTPAAAGTPPDDRPSDSPATRARPGRHITAAPPATTLVLPTGLSSRARLVGLEDPATGALRQYLYDPARGVYEFTAVGGDDGGGGGAPRSILFTTTRPSTTDVEVAGTGGDPGITIALQLQFLAPRAALKVRTPLLATPVDLLFFVLPLLLPAPSPSSRSQADKRPATFQALDDMLDARWDHDCATRQVLRGPLRAVDSDNWFLRLSDKALPRSYPGPLPTHPRHGGLPTSPRHASSTGSRRVTPVRTTPAMSTTAAATPPPITRTVARDPTPPPLPDGPHPSFILVAHPYIFAPTIQACLDTTAAQADPLREEAVRMQGISWIDSVRKALHLPVRTFTTAATFFHKYRLTHTAGEYNPSDAAAAALFTACKVEDTLKKSKDILVAAYNLRAAPGTERVTTDDPIIDMQSRAIIGLERQMLECSGFDFRNRHPQKTILKLIKRYGFDRAVPPPPTASAAAATGAASTRRDSGGDVVMGNTAPAVSSSSSVSGVTGGGTSSSNAVSAEKSVARIAYAMSLDMYRTYAPLKQTTPTMAFACLELTTRLYSLWSPLRPSVPASPTQSTPGTNTDTPVSPDLTATSVPDSTALAAAHAFRTAVQSGEAYKQWSTSRAEVMETMLDLLELYTHHRNVTTVGPEFNSEWFLRCTIPLNQECEERHIPRYAFSARTRRDQSGDAGGGDGDGRAKAKDRDGPTLANGHDNHSPANATPRSASVVATPRTPGSSSHRSHGMPANPLMPKPAYDVPDKLPNGNARDGTLRYVLDPEEAKAEKETVAEYYDVKIEEYEVEE
ncbi:RNA polymerase II C-terminal domain kinase beta subunit [Ascosphaera acerosa]|nr:RNA polymerase II C-terminal domain kinase beta subunit [Ascosphaera acerosa]